MSPQTKIQYATAVLMVVSGVVLTFVCFFRKGDITEAVLWYVAQSLTFAGSVFGISLYLNYFKNEANSKFHAGRNDGVGNSQKTEDTK